MLRQRMIKVNVDTIKKGDAECQNPILNALLESKPRKMSVPGIRQLRCRWGATPLNDMNRRGNGIVIRLPTPGKVAASQRALYRMRKTLRHTGLSVTLANK